MSYDAKADWEASLLAAREATDRFQPTGTWGVWVKPANCLLAKFLVARGWAHRITGKPGVIHWYPNNTHEEPRQRAYCQALAENLRYRGWDAVVVSPEPVKGGTR